MTDITNQDRRTAIDVAEAIERGDYPMANMWPILARVILATVDAPAPTLAEELRSWAEDASYDEDRDNLLHAADRAEQVEKERDEARAEVERVTRERERSLAQVQGLARRESDLTSEVRMLTEERDEARAEVDSLTAVNEELRRTDNYREFKEFLGVQKGAESNAETPTPADVQPGEAWIVKVGREKRTAVKDTDAGVPWNTVNTSGVFHAEYNEDVTLLTRLVPAPRVITNHDELEHLAATSIIRDGRGWPGGITDQRGVMVNGFCLSYEDVLSLGPVTVLWEPGV